MSGVRGQTDSGQATLSRAEISFSRDDDDTSSCRCDVCTCRAQVRARDVLSLAVLISKTPVSLRDVEHARKARCAVNHDGLLLLAEAIATCGDPLTMLLLQQEPLRPAQTLNCV